MIIVIGEILIDIFDDYQRIGGAPFNFAFHLKQLGIPVRFLTRVGDDADGEKILDLMRKHQFDLNDVQIDPRHPTGTVRVTLDNQGVPKFDIVIDVAYDYIDLAGFASLESQTADMIYFGSLSQRGDYLFKQIHGFVQNK